VSAVPMPAPVALARLVDSLTPPGGSALIFEPKWDGWRAQYSRGVLYSRNGTNLTRLFPDLVPVLAARLTPDLHLDGELVSWQPTAGRLDFAGLQARMTAGKRIRAVARQRPAQFVVFDVLAAGGEDLRSRPLRERRLVLERALSGLGSPIVLRQQTEDLVTAREWLHTRRWRPGGGRHQGRRRQLPHARRPKTVVEVQTEGNAGPARDRVHRLCVGAHLPGAGLPGRCRPGRRTGHCRVDHGAEQGGG